jgi:hypothetical protein
MTIWKKQARRQMAVCARPWNFQSRARQPMEPAFVSSCFHGPVCVSRYSGSRTGLLNGESAFSKASDVSARRKRFS